MGLLFALACACSPRCLRRSHRWFSLAAVPHWVLCCAMGRADELRRLAARLAYALRKSHLGGSDLVRFLGPLSDIVSDLGAEVRHLQRSSPFVNAPSHVGCAISLFEALASRVAPSISLQSCHSIAGQRSSISVAIASSDHLTTFSDLVGAWVPLPAVDIPCHSSPVSLPSCDVIVGSTVAIDIVFPPSNCRMKRYVFRYSPSLIVQPSDAASFIHRFHLDASSQLAAYDLLTVHIGEVSVLPSADDLVIFSAAQSLADQFPIPLRCTIVLSCDAWLLRFPDQMYYSPCTRRDLAQELLGSGFNRELRCIV